MSRWERKSEEFKKAAVERMKTCPNISRLCEELGVARRSLYSWKSELGEQRSKTTAEQRLLRDNEKLKLALAEKVLQVDFCKGVLRRIEERKRRSTGLGATTSTPKSEQ